MSEDAEELSDEMEHALAAFVAGYLAGHHAGIIAAANMAKAALEENAPFPPNAKQWIAMFGRALERAAPEMKVQK